MKRLARPPAAIRLVGGLACVLALAWAPGCGGPAPLPTQDQWIGVEVGADAVTPGRAFPLTVTRIWHARLAAAAWDDAVLAPLEVRLQTLVRDEDGERIREVRDYHAWAFSLDDVQVLPIPFAARPPSGGDAQVVHAPAFTVRVRPTLLPSQAGAPELPGPPLADPPSRDAWLGLGIGLALASTLGLGVVATRRRRPPPTPVELPAVEPPAPSPAEIALAELGRLRAGDGSVAAVTEVVRTYVAGRYEVPASFLSSEEVLAAPVIGDDVHARLAAILGLGDRTKFAAHHPTSTEREAQLTAAEAFVRVTASGGAS